jgi:hypothetical protein
MLARVDHDAKARYAPYKSLDLDEATVRPNGVAAGK